MASTQFALAGSNYDGIDAADAGNATWETGTYYAMPPLAAEPMETDPFHDEMPVTFAGTRGS